MSKMHTKIFNTDRNYLCQNLFLGDDPGLFDTVNKQHVDIWKLYKELKSQDWDENEFDYSTCNADFKTCGRSTYEMMLMTLAWQWETDSVAARSIIGVMSPFITSTELTAAWTQVSSNEVVHAATYSEIVRGSFDDPRAVIKDILSVKESFSRLSIVADVMGQVHRAAHEYALGLRENNQDTYNYAYLFTAALLILERVQFMSSFPVTFTIVDTGLFVQAGKAVQKIAQDELEVHVEIDKAILMNEHRTERGRVAYQQTRAMLQKLIVEVVRAEMNWADVLFSEGRQLVGMTPDLLKKWILYSAGDVFDFLNLDIPTEWQIPTHTPLKFMSNWLNSGKIQAAPMEEQNGQYRVGVMRRTDTGKTFDTDF